MKRYILLFAALCGICFSANAQSLERTVCQRLRSFFKNYETSYAEIGVSKLDSFKIDHEGKVLRIYANAVFGYQSFTEENTSAIYRSLKQVLPGPVNYYSLRLYADGRLIEDLIPNAFRKEKDKSRLYGKIDYKGEPWVKNISRPFDVTQGLYNRHLVVWQSHGRFYRNDSGKWRWQRPPLFCTREDLFTQSFVVPYLIPMLENAGAVVYTPRERDWQHHEVIVDNNTCSPGSRYLEVNHKKHRWSDTGKPGFAQKYLTYPDNHNPFADGTARFIATQPKSGKSFAEWIPNIPEKGRYAVYVSYQTLPASVTDAKYLVFHNGGVTEFEVNQQMGGGTWVYLGTFEFDKGMNDYGMVVLTNESSEKGVVCADAVRFGGGMGNIVRGGKVSGLPRYLEGARYAAQWAGMPYSIYSKSGGENDYNDDINARSLTTNYLSGGSVYNPVEKGLKVPFELSVALHSDAGYKEYDSLVGSLGIYTTGFNDGRLNCGISRYASRDLADMVLTGLQRDISSRFGVRWIRRGMWNRNYSETRLPAVPSMILELLSHQNFADMKLGHDPAFKFTVGRSVYKSVLKYVAEMHGTDYTVQPLPVSHFAIHEGEKKNTFTLRWIGTEDVLEPSANPQGYIVYTRIGYGGFDNGVYVRKPEYTVKVEPGLVYSFKVTAVNKGGESFPSEILSAYKAKHSRGTILVVNAFDKLCGPSQVESPLREGFDLWTDPGLPYQNSPAFCGYQQGFDRSRMGVETEGGLGFSDNTLEGRLIAGNTFDYVFVHGKSIQRGGRYSFVSCSDETVESGSVRLTDYAMVDFICGADDEAFSPEIRKALTDYCAWGGCLFISGSRLAKGLEADDFGRKVLKCTDGGMFGNQHGRELSGANRRFRIEGKANGRIYAVPSMQCVLPAQGAYSTFVYTDGNYGTGTAYRGADYRTFVLGFPFECIQDTGTRDYLMQVVMNTLLKEK